MEIDYSFPRDSLMSFTESSRRMRFGAICVFLVSLFIHTTLGAQTRAVTLSLSLEGENVFANFLLESGESAIIEFSDQNGRILESKTILVVESEDAYVSTRIDNSSANTNIAFIEKNNPVSVPMPEYSEIKDAGIKLHIQTGQGENARTIAESTEVGVRDWLERLAPPLPPDPGAAGMATIRGIDSNGNGVRDDVEREIYFYSPGNSNAMDALAQQAMALQQAAATGSSATPSTEQAIAVTEQLLQTAFCLGAVVPDSTAALDFLTRTVIDTKDRLIGYFKYQQLSGGGSFDISSSCAQAEARTAGARTARATAEEATVETKIYFINGVLNTRKDAVASMLALGEAYFSSQKPAVRIGLSHNKTVSLKADIIETLYQRLLQEGVEENKIIAYLLTLGDITSDLFILSVLRDYSNLQKKIRSTARKLGIVILRHPVEVIVNFIIEDAGSLEKHFKTFKTLEESFKKEYRNYLDQRDGNRILLIAHSQGNLYANPIYESLSETYNNKEYANPFYESLYQSANRVGLIGIASPATTQPAGSSYFTAHDDLVIDSVRRVAGALPGNIDNPLYMDKRICSIRWGTCYTVKEDLRDISKHKFMESYFRPGLPSRGAIDAAVEQFICPKSPTGPLTGRAERVGNVEQFGVGAAGGGLASHNGTLYMVGANPPALYRLNSATGRARRVGNVGGFGAGVHYPSGLASHNGTLYMVDATPPALYRLNPLAGEAERVGNVEYFGVDVYLPSGLASHNGTLYMVGVIPPALYSLHPLTGEAERVGNVGGFGAGVRHQSGLTSHNGTLYMVGATYSSSPHAYTYALYRLNPLTGEAERVGNVEQGFGVGAYYPTGLTSHNGTLYMVVYGTASSSTHGSITYTYALYRLIKRDAIAGYCRLPA